MTYMFGVFLTFTNAIGEQRLLFNIRSTVQRLRNCLRQAELRYRKETALQGALVLAKSGRLELGDNIFRTLYVNLQSP